MRKNLLIIHLFYSVIILLCSCNFPYQPKQFVLPEIPYKFPASQTIKTFTDNAKKVKCAYSLKEGAARWLYFVDFNDTSPHPIKLKKPKDKKDMHADSPIISPDGTFVAYYMTEGGAMVNGAYIQKLDSLSDPVLIAVNGTEPHWWVNAEG